LTLIRLKVINLLTLRGYKIYSTFACTHQIAFRCIIKLTFGLSSTLTIDSSEIHLFSYQMSDFITPNKHFLCNDERCRQSTYNAARNGHLECLRHAHENVCEWDFETTCAAAGNGHLECLRYARENGCEWHPETTYAAAKNGHLECLRYSHDNGCEWHTNTTWGAAYNGHLECLRYSHDNGCEWHPKTTYIAAVYGHLECLRYARENGCEWHPETTYAAAKNGHLECLMSIAARGGHLVCLMYIYEHCGHVATWEDANLEDENGVVSGIFSKEIQDYINSVKDDWKRGFNKPGYNIKGC